MLCRKFENRIYSTICSTIKRSARPIDFGGHACYCDRGAGAPKIEPDL